jgi:hypothetical protein
MKQIVLSFLLLSAIVTTKAQLSGTRTINTTGSTASAGGIVLEWSVGEMVAVQTLISPNVILTQGLIQPGASSGAPLPVTLLFFKGKAVNGQTVLSWATSREINSQHFDVERSSNAIDFTKFGQVAAAHNSSITTQYSLTDPGPYPSTYYRLKQVDMDGQYSYSRIVQIQLSQTLTFGLYPNPTNGVLNLSLKGNLEPVEVMVTDMKGRTVWRKIVDPVTTVQIDVSYLPGGSYFVTVQGGGNTRWSGKFLKQ